MAQMCNVIYYATDKIRYDRILDFFETLVRDTARLEVCSHESLAFPVMNQVPSPTNQVAGDVAPMSFLELRNKLSSKITATIEIVGTALAAHFDKMIVRNVPENVRNGFLSNTIICHIGQHSLVFDDPFSVDEVLLSKLQFSMAFWDYSLPLDHDKFLESIETEREFVEHLELSLALARSLRVGVFYSL